MKPNETDLDRIDAEIRRIADVMAANTHAPTLDDISDSVTVTKNGWIATAVDLGRLAVWVAGLSATHKASRAEPAADSA